MFDIWEDRHRYNENLVLLLPWAAHMVFHTIGACSALIDAFGTQVRFPEELAPGYRVFTRDYTNHALLDLYKVHCGEPIWWGDGGLAAAPPGTKA